MSEKLIMPKNVQSFVDKYGGIGSKEQDSAFWKGFRKAANAYANVQAKRICDLENALAEERKHRNEIEDKLRVDLRGLSEALLELRNNESMSLGGAAYEIIEQALQSLNQNAQYPAAGSNRNENEK